MSNHIEVNDYLLTIESHVSTGDSVYDYRIANWFEIETDEDGFEIEMGTQGEANAPFMRMGEKEASAICKLLLKWLNKTKELPELKS